MQPLPRDFYDRSPVTVARALIGTLLVRRSRDGTCVGRILETEAYLATNDSACHAYRGRNRKNATMFGRPGSLYVYTIHARCCLNAVTERRGVPSAVLIRALEPLLGLDLMRRRRGKQRETDLARGPARLCEALAVDRRLDGWDLVRGERIWIAAADSRWLDASIGVSPRVGVTSAQELELRFYLRGSRFVSGH